MPSSDRLDQVTADKVSLKELREKFYELRNFEISNLWQRSIFLSALLVLFFSSYGFTITQLYSGGSANVKEHILHAIASAISLLGLTFSIIWIKMAKGSKAWYEIYESKIIEIEKEDALNIHEKYRMGYDCYLGESDRNILSTNAGQFSVSKLNIIIGQTLMVTWAAITVLHITITCKLLNYKLIIDQISNIGFIIPAISVSVVLVYILCGTLFFGNSNSITSQKIIK